jgi:hypothetical protein
MVSSLRPGRARRPRSTVSAILKAEGDLSKGAHKKRRAGMENDWLRFGGIDSLELEKIRTPTLVINGTT